MEDNIKTAYFAGGCFWGVEFYFQQQEGVVSATSGYMGGGMPYPDYRSVCTGNTGHIETVAVKYDNSIVSFEQLAKLFFEIHDFTQVGGQGPDIGSQYISAVFYNNEDEKNKTKELIKILENKGYKVATKLISTYNTPFFEAEDYHQKYYEKTGKLPYCHVHRKVF